MNYNSNNINRPNKRIIAKPFVKWAGGKGSLLSKLEEFLPKDFDKQKDVTYIEPFVGGGAMLFHMLQNHPCIKKVVINDINPDLVRCYELIAYNPQLLIERLRNIENNYFNEDIRDRKELYYAYRDQFNSSRIDPDERAALLIFLNHTCFNGLFRVNAAGKFNVPYGRYKRPIICNELLILECHKVLSSVHLIIRKPGDYKLTRQNISKRNTNFFYFDPPYRPISNTSSFKEYSNNSFGDKQQVELKQFCDKLSGYGCQFMLSNSDSMNEDGTSYFEQLYEGYRLSRLLAPRFISADANKREKKMEVLIKNY